MASVECLQGTLRVLVAERQALRERNAGPKALESNRRELGLLQRELSLAGEKWFCGTCGSAMFGSNPSHPESIGIRMGTPDGDPGIRPSVRQFVAYAAPWEPLPNDGLQRFQESRHPAPQTPPEAKVASCPAEPKGSCDSGRGNDLRPTSRPGRNAGVSRGGGLHSRSTE